MKSLLARSNAAKARVASIKERGGVLAVLRTQGGAIDLASIMVGVLVIGIIGGVIAATVFAVIPWSQEQAARGNLDAIKTAQSVEKTQTNAYQTGSKLTADGLLPVMDPIKVDTKATTAGWVAASKSDDGKIFRVDSTHIQAVDVTNQSFSNTYNLLPPAVQTPTIKTTNGTLAAGTYYYVMTSLANGESIRSNEVSVTVPSGTTNIVDLPFTVIPGVTNYVVYRSSTSGTEGKLSQIGGITSQANTPFQDTGFSTPQSATTPPATSSATYTITSAITDVASALASEK